MKKIKTPNIFDEEEIVKKDSGNKFLIFLIFFLAVCVMTPSAIGVFNSFSIQKETRELHSLQNEAAQIKKDASDLSERIKTFNNEVEVVLNSREKFPAGEFIPEKINLCKILGGKEAP